MRQISLGLINIYKKGNGVMDSALACCAGSPGSIPAVGKSNVQYSDGFSLSVKGGRLKRNGTCR